MPLTLRLISRLALCVALAGVCQLPAKIVRNVEKTFAVQPAGTLNAKLNGGDIVIKTADIAEVRVTVRETIQADDDRKADELLKDLTLRLEQQGNDITAEARYEGPMLSGWFRGRTPVSVDFFVTVPRQFHLSLTTSGGDIRSEGLQGSVRGTTSGGDIVLGAVAGPVVAKTSGGDIRLQECTDSTELTTSGGDIRAGRVDGRAALITSGGDIEATLGSEASQEAQLETSGGDVQLHVPAKRAFLLDARTSGGTVSAAGLTLTIDDGAFGQSSLKGRVNGGNALVKVRSSGGDIVIRTDGAAN
ncbi:MAG TPA: DUF4097 family beta strand repeat-containing protein [Opitutaceae bacterium]|nr:DUF4097 family beta strand repeat-containing protein [Opitutaceae bacterium]